jgi:hypothetical protein
LALGHILAMLYACDGPYNPGGLLGVILFGVAIAVPIYVAASAGLSIARDRELGAWNHLRLADLKPAEIARAKMLAPIITGLSYASILLPLALFAWCVMRSNRGSYDYNNDARVLWGITLALPLAVLGTLQLSGWASLCSLRAKRSTIALVATFAGALIFLVGVPTLFELTRYGQMNYDYEAQEQTMSWFGHIHPIFAFHTQEQLLRYIQQISNPDDYLPSYHTPFNPILCYATTLLSQSAITYAFYRKVTHEIAAREK